MHLDEWGLNEIILVGLLEEIRDYSLSNTRLHRLPFIKDYLRDKIYDALLPPYSQIEASPLHQYEMMKLFTNEAKPIWNFMRLEKALLQNEELDMANLKKWAGLRLEHATELLKLLKKKFEKTPKYEKEAHSMFYQLLGAASHYKEIHEKIVLDMNSHKSQICSVRNVADLEKAIVESVGNNQFSIYANEFFPLSLLYSIYSFK